MFRNFYLLFILSFFSLCCLGQEQITAFKSVKNVGSNRPGYQSKLNNKVFFTSFTPETGTELWVSDGTTENTKLLKDFEPGSNSSNFYDFTEYKGHLYFLTIKHEVWKTDGSPSGTSLVFHSDSLSNMYSVSGKILLTFRGDGLQAVQRYPFGWLDDSGHVEVWENKATTFIVQDNALYYSTYDTLGKQWAFNVYDKTPHAIYQRKGDYVRQISVAKFKGYDYFSISTLSESPALLVANAEDRAQPATLYNWATGFAPISLKDTTGALFLIKDHAFENGSKSLQIYKVLSGTSWQEIANLPSSKMYPSPQGMEGPYASSFFIQGDNLSFLSVYGIETVSAVNLNVFNFKTNTKRISGKLPTQIAQRNLVIKPKSEDIYQISTVGIRVTYDLAKDQTVGLETIPIVESPVLAGTNKFEVTDNLYLLTTAGKKPLINLKDVFVESGLRHRDTLNNQILFWTYSDEIKKSQLWTSDGNTTREIFQYEGNVDSYNLTRQGLNLKNNIIFTVYSDAGIKIIKTDGTTEGTKELYNLSKGATSSIANILINKNEVVFETYSESGRTLIVTNLEETKEIDLSKFQYYDLLKTDDKFYLVDNTPKDGFAYGALFEISQGLLKPVPLGPGVIPQYLQVYQNKIYYTARDASMTGFSGIFYLDNVHQTHRLYTGGVYTFAIRASYLTVTDHDPNSGMDHNTVVRLASGKTIASFDGMYSSYAVSGNGLALWSPYRIMVFNGNDTQDLFFDQLAGQPVTAPGGFFIKGQSSTTGDNFYYYSNKEKKLIPIVESTGLEMVYEANQQSAVFYGSEAGKTKGYVWNIFEQKLGKLPENTRVTSQLNDRLFTVIKGSDYSKTYVYALDNGSFSEKYSFDNPYNSDVMRAGNSNYFPIYSAATGSEVTRFEKDSIFHFAEIVKGAEGIALQQVFHFKNAVYAAGFTFSKGLQVWKMGDVIEEPKDVIEPESEVADGRVTPGLPDNVTFLPDDLDINTYPNPVINEVNIDVRTPGTLFVVDANGIELIKKASGTKTVVDLKNLAPGQYIIIFTNPKIKLVKKIIKL